jgi:hypothetical protein
MYLWKKFELEDKQREEKYLASIGQIGRLFDSHIGFCVTISLLMPLGFAIGFGIGSLL